MGFFKAYISYNAHYFPHKITGSHPLVEVHRIQKYPIFSVHNLLFIVFGPATLAAAQLYWKVSISPLTSCECKLEHTSGGNPLLESGTVQNSRL